MDSIIETTRQTHEDIERYESALAEVLMQNPTAARNITRRDRKAADILGRIGTLRQDLVGHYIDEPSLRPAELALLSAPTTGGDDLVEFYRRFEDINNFHRKNPDINARQFLNELDELVKGDGMQIVQDNEEDEPIIIDPLDSVFTGEEAYGKHLDFNALHAQYLNLRGANRLSYIAYLDMLRHGKVERTLDTKEKSVPEYLAYIQGVYNYLISFFDRALPLIDVQKRLTQAEDDFATAWEAGRVEGWEAETSSKPKQVEGGIWCPYCQKHYSKQTVYDAHLTSEKHKKREKAGKMAPDPEHSANGTANGASTSGSSSSRDKLRTPARLTYRVHSLLTFQPIPTLLAESRSEIERRMALTAREREAELEEQDDAPPPPAETQIDGEEDEEEEGKIYNPLKLPLGWDGKPIPYWLYKLHGLGVEFRCEICSDYVYQGRRAFDRHFQESRHAYGMRALGLPNTKHFHEITKIADAMALAEKLKREGRAEIAAAEAAEEYEDEQGNVYSKRVYEDLKRQGLL